MPIESLILGTILGSFSALAAASPGEVDRCKAGCTSGTDTDRATCRINCESAARAKATPNVVHYEVDARTGKKTVTHVDGKPVDGSARPAPRATITPTTGPSPSTAPAPAPASTPYAAMAACQATCDGTSRATDRATCKLQCLGYTRSTTADGTGRPSPAPTSGTSVHAAPVSNAPPSASCLSGCDNPGLSATDRATCQANCRQDAASSGWRSQVVGPATNPSPASAPTPAATAVACGDRNSCLSGCHVKTNACSSSCASSGSNAATCRLQCEQQSSSCMRRCPHAC